VTPSSVCIKGHQEQVTPPFAPENGGISRVGDDVTYPKNIFLGVGDDVTHPKIYFRGG
jgi:hypothetical protein